MSNNKYSSSSFPPIANRTNCNRAIKSVGNQWSNLCLGSHLASAIDRMLALKMITAEVKSWNDLFDLVYRVRSSIIQVKVAKGSKVTPMKVLIESDRVETKSPIVSICSCFFILIMAR